MFVKEQIIVTEETKGRHIYFISFKYLQFLLFEKQVYTK